MDLKRLGRILRECRVRADIKQEYLALKIGVEQSYISKVEKGERTLNALQLLNWLSITKQEKYFIYELAKGMSVYEVAEGMKANEVLQEIQTLVGVVVQRKRPYESTYS